MSAEQSHPEASSDDDSRRELRESLIESLLQSAFQTDARKSEARINAVLEQISSAENVVARSPNSTAAVRNVRRWERWLAVAAALVVVVTMSYVLIPNGSSVQAMSAIERSIVAAKESVARKYRLVITRRTARDSTRTIESDLYVAGSDRIAIRYPHPVFVKSSFWLGDDGNEAWLVPPLGPIRLGNQTEVGKWLGQQEDISTPYLHVETILKKMRNGYRLEEQPDTVITLSNGETRHCIHIKATYRRADRATVREDGQEPNKAPTTIEFWSDVETGIALRLDGRWDKPDKTRRKRVVIEYIDEPTLPENWFKPEAHVSNFRRRMRFDE